MGRPVVIKANDSASNNALVEPKKRGRKAGFTKAAFGAKKLANAVNYTKKKFGANATKKVSDTSITSDADPKNKIVKVSLKAKPKTSKASEVSKKPSVAKKLNAKKSKPVKTKEADAKAINTISRLGNKSLKSFPAPKVKVMNGDKRGRKPGIKNKVKDAPIVEKPTIDKPQDQ